MISSHGHKGGQCLGGGAVPSCRRCEAVTHFDASVLGLAFEADAADCPSVSYSCDAVKAERTLLAVLGGRPEGGGGPEYVTVEREVMSPVVGFVGAAGHDPFTFGSVDRMQLKAVGCGGRS